MRLQCAYRGRSLRKILAHEQSLSIRSICAESVGRVNSCRCNPLVRFTLVDGPAEGDCATTSVVYNAGTSLNWDSPVLLAVPPTKRGGIVRRLGALRIEVVDVDRRGTEDVLASRTLDFNQGRSGSLRDLALNAHGEATDCSLSCEWALQFDMARISSSIAKRRRKRKAEKETIMAVQEVENQPESVEARLQRQMTDDADVPVKVLLLGTPTSLKLRLSDGLAARTRGTVLSLAALTKAEMLRPTLLDETDAGTLRACAAAGTVPRALHCLLLHRAAARSPPPHFIVDYPSTAEELKALEAALGTVTYAAASTFCSDVSVAVG